jgi:hypothetical protein
MTLHDNGPKLTASADPIPEASESIANEFDATVGPEAPTSLNDTGIEPEVLVDLVLKMAITVPHFTTDWAARRLCLPRVVVSECLDRLVEEKLILIRGQAGPLDYRFAITSQGQSQGDRLMQISGYVGPAPVPLEAYVRMLELQITRFPKVSPEDVTAAISDMILPEEATQIAGLAVSSGRSLFIFGPPGNGKTSLGRALHRALEGELWIPYCIGIGSHVIRIFDPQCHERIPVGDSSAAAAEFDRRWVRIGRPFILVGGELTLDALDLVHGYSRGFYEAPLHVKANGGIFLLDDFGCQHVEPHELVNRWIVPLEHSVDYLTLQTGQQIEVPFQQMLIISTNMNPNDVITPGLLRRLGYRLYLGNPAADRYSRIFSAYSAKCGIDLPAGLLAKLLERYGREKRPLRCCEPRDLIERARDICRFRDQPAVLNEEIMDLAWNGYFANQEPME